MAILEFFWRSLVAREVAKQIEVVFKITGGVTKFLRAQLSENSRVRQIEHDVSHFIAFVQVMTITDFLL